MFGKGVVEHGNLVTCLRSFGISGCTSYNMGWQSYFREMECHHWAKAGIGISVRLVSYTVVVLEKTLAIIVLRGGSIL